MAAMPMVSVLDDGGSRTASETALVAITGPVYDRPVGDGIKSDGPGLDGPVQPTGRPRRHVLETSRTHGIATVEAAVKRLQGVAADVSKVISLTDDDLRQLKQYYKWGVRHQMAGPAELLTRTAVVHAYVAELLARVTPDNQRAIEEKLANAASRTTRRRTQHATAPARRAERAPRTQPGQLLPIAMDSLPDADMLNALANPSPDDSPADRQARWRAALTVSRRVNTQNVAKSLHNAQRMDMIARRRAVYVLKAVASSARAAMAQVLKREPLPEEIRWAQRLWKAPDIGAASIDRRWERATEPMALCPLTKALTLKFYLGRRGATRRAITKLVNQEIATYETYAKRDGVFDSIPRISRSTVARFLNAIPRAFGVIREKGFAEFKKQGRIVDSWDEATYANEIWEIDHTPLDIAVVLSADQPDKVVTVWATACIDAYSGLCVALFLSSQHPDAFTTSLVLAMAINAKEVAGTRVGGLPTILRPDHGSDFMSKHVAKVAAALPITLDPAAQEHPDGKPHVERFFRTLNKQLAEFPGYTPTDGKSDGAKRRQIDRLLTVRQLIEQVQGLVADMATHSRERGEGTPIERYKSTVKWREPVDREELELLLRQDERKLTREGIRINNIWYKGMPATAGGHNLVELVGTKVTVLWHPDILDAVYVYTLAGDRIGEFWREELWKAEVGAVQVNGDVLPRLKHLLRGYSRQLEKEDRRYAKAARVNESETRIAERLQAEASYGPLPITTAHPASAIGKSKARKRLAAPTTTAPSVQSPTTVSLLQRVEQEAAAPVSIFDDLPD